MHFFASGGSIFLPSFVILVDMSQKQAMIEQFFRSYYVRMYRLAKVLLHDDEESKDAVSDVFTRLVQADILPDADKMEGYLYVAVRNRCLDIIAHRQLRERVERLLRIDEAVCPPGIEEAERLEFLRRLVDTELTEQTRRVFLLKYEAQLLPKEIADTLGMSERTVYKHLTHAITKLHKILKDHEL